MNRIVTFCLLLGLATGCTPLRPCRGTPGSVYRTCGCHPRDDAFITRLDRLSLPSVAKQAARRCVKGNVALNARGRDIVDGDLALCLEQENSIDDASRATLLSELKSADDEAAFKTDESQLWRACYESITGLGGAAAERARAERLRQELEAKDLELQQVFRLKDTLEREVSACQDQLSHASSELARLEEENTVLKKQLADATLDKDGLRVQISLKEQALQDSRKTVKALTTLAESRKQQHGQDLRAIEHLRHELEGLRSELEQACESLRSAGLGDLCDDATPRS